MNKVDRDELQGIIVEALNGSAKPITQDQCKETSGSIREALESVVTQVKIVHGEVKEVNGALQGVNINLAKHLSFHNGKEKQEEKFFRFKQGNVSSWGLVLRWVILCIAVLTGVTGAAFAIGKITNKSEEEKKILVKEVAREVAKVVNNNGVNFGR